MHLKKSILAIIKLCVVLKFFFYLNQSTHIGVTNFFTVSTILTTWLFSMAS